MSYWDELKRRNVVRAAAAYLAFGWLIVEVASIALPAFDFSNAHLRALIIALVLGFPIALVCSWLYEVTPDGIKLTEDDSSADSKKIGFGRRMDFVIIGALSLALIAVVIDQYVLEDAVPYESIAVLPFKNLSGDPDQEYFADGMTDTLIANLGQVKSLAVISRTSTMRFKHSDQSLPSIAAALGASVIVEASAQRVADRILVSVRLIDGEDDRQIWSRTFEEDFTNVLQLQSNMAQEIVDGVQAALTPEEQVRLAANQPVNPATYDAYLRGMAHLHRLLPEDFDLAEGYFERARDLNPQSVLGWTGLAMTWGYRAQTNAVPVAVAAPAVRENAERAALIGDESSAVQRALAAADYLDRSYAQAEVHARRAIQLEPSSTDALSLLATLRQIFGDYDESVELTARTTKLDPLNPFFKLLHAVALMGARQYDASIAAYREALDMAPNLGTAWQNLSACLHHARRFDEAIVAKREWLHVTRNADGLTAFDAGLADGGYEEGIRRLALVLARRSSASGLDAVTVARHYGYAGDSEKTIEWMERAFALGDPNVAQIRMPSFDAVRDDPRIQALMEELGI